MTITCQHSGIKFESKSGRAKNHPALDSILKDAYKRGVYGETMDALKNVREAGGYTTIEQYLELVNERINAAVTKRRERDERRRQNERDAEAAAQEMRRRREAQNALLREHGYRWSKNYAYDFDSYEENRDGSFVWELHAPDGRLVEIDRALDEIARGADVVRAEEEAAAAAERARQEAAEREAEAEREREREARRRVETIEVEPFDHAGFECIYQHGGLTIYAGQINGVAAGVVNRYRSYGNDFDDDYRHFCADPEAAGLMRVQEPEPASMEETFRRIWRV